MIADFSFMMWILALAVPGYWAIPSDRPAARYALLSVLSAFLLFLLSPLILLTVVLYGLIVLGFRLAARHQIVAKKRLKQATWGVFLPMALIQAVPADLWAAGILGAAAEQTPLLAAFALLGLSYTAIRSFLLIREALDGQDASWSQTITALLFFGSFTAGPITGGGPYRAPADRLTRDMAVMGLARIGWGAALFIVVKPIIAGFDPAASLGAQGRSLEWLLLYRNFLTLYVDFTGYSDIAIGTALLFGIRLPENFRWPLRATSIQEFWQRWHLSLGAFISTYLFKPFVREVGKPSLAIFLAFTCVGLWHAITLPYFLWGVGHGAALALNMVLRKRIPVATWQRPYFVAQRLAGWAITMSYVALLSAFANQPDLAQAWALLTRLF